MNQKYISLERFANTPVKLDKTGVFPFLDIEIKAIPVLEFLAVCQHLGYYDPETQKQKIDLIGLGKLLNNEELQNKDWVLLRSILDPAGIWSDYVLMLSLRHKNNDNFCGNIKAFFEFHWIKIKMSKDKIFKILAECNCLLMLVAKKGDEIFDDQKKKLFKFTPKVIETKDEIANYVAFFLMFKNTFNEINGRAVKFNDFHTLLTYPQSEWCFNNTEVLFTYWLALFGKIASYFVKNEEEQKKNRSISEWWTEFIDVMKTRMPKLNVQDENELFSEETKEEILSWQYRSDSAIYLMFYDSFKLRKLYGTTNTGFIDEHKE